MTNYYKSEIWRKCHKRLFIFVIPKRAWTEIIKKKTFLTEPQYNGTRIWYKFLNSRFQWLNETNDTRYFLVSIQRVKFLLRPAISLVISVIQILIIKNKNDNIYNKSHHNQHTVYLYMTQTSGSAELGISLRHLFESSLNLRWRFMTSFKVYFKNF